MLAYSNHRYNKVTRILHWAMAILIITLLILGWYMSGLDKKDAVRPVMYLIHKSIGVLVFELAVLRIAWMLYEGGIKLSERLTRGEKWMVWVSHAILYGMIIVIPLSGYTISSTGGYPVTFFGLYDIPLLLEKSKPVFNLARGFHYWLAYITVFVVLSHIYGGYRHQFKETASLGADD